GLQLIENLRLGVAQCPRPKLVVPRLLEKPLLVGPALPQECSGLVIAPCDVAAHGLSSRSGSASARTKRRPCTARRPDGAAPSSRSATRECRSTRSRTTRRRQSLRHAKPQARRRSRREPCKSPNSRAR